MAKSPFHFSNLTQLLKGQVKVIFNYHETYVNNALTLEGTFKSTLNDLFLLNFGFSMNILLETQMLDQLPIQ